MSNALPKLKILAALGPGDLVASFEFWKNKQRIPSETSIPYSHQFFDFSTDLKFSAWVISSHTQKGIVASNDLIVENRPKNWHGAGGIRFYLAQLLYAFSLFKTALIYRPHIVMIDSGTTHYSLMLLFRILGCKVVANFHNVIWPMGFPPVATKDRMLIWLDSLFFRYFCSGCMGVSLECSRQANALAKHDIPFFLYYGQFAQDDFESFEHVVIHRGSLKVLYAGRIERNKGALDIVEIAGILWSRVNCHVTFEVCGDGGAISELRKSVRDRELDSIVRVLGRLDRNDLVEAYRRNHVVIVPTRTSIGEGFAMVVAEAILARRPVVASSVVPALEVLRPACLEAVPDNPESFADCLEKLASSPDLVLQLSHACDPLRSTFLDGNFSYYRALTGIVEKLVKI